MWSRFDRAPNGVSQTEQGSLLLRCAQKAAALAAQAAAKLASGDGNLSGRFALGVSTTIARCVLPRLIGAFLSEHPYVQLSLQSGNTAEIVRQLLEDKVAIGLVEGPARDREVRTEPFVEDEMVLSQLSPERRVFLLGYEALSPGVVPRSRPVRLFRTSRDTLPRNCERAGLLELPGIHILRGCKERT